jgi:hypothetical protein
MEKRRGREEGGEGEKLKYHREGHVAQDHLTSPGLIAVLHISHIQMADVCFGDDP